MTAERNTPMPEMQPEAAPETPLVPSHESKGRKTVSGSISNVLGGAFLVREKVIRLLPFLLFLAMLALVYIFSTNYANRTVISISKTKKMNEELRFNYITTRSKLMQASRQSEVAERLLLSGIKESKVPPRKIVINQTEK